MNVAGFIESSGLSPWITGKDIDRLVSEAKELSVFGVCVPPFWVKRASREIGDHDLQLITVVGFPLGYQMTEVKQEEARLALRDGANEIDMVMNISSFKDGMPWTKIELAKMSKMVHDQQALLKVIIEVGYLDEKEIIQAARLCSDAGVDFVKTSTGYASDGNVTDDHVRILRDCLPSNVGIKASGGIKSRAQVDSLIKAGADRIGTSNAKQIMTWQQKG